MDPNLSALAAYPGEYQQELISQLYNSIRFEQEGIKLIPGVKNKLNMHKLLVSDGAKPYTGKFIAKDDIALQPRVLSVEKAQRDLEIEPEKYRATFMANMRGKGENANNQTIPFAPFMWNSVMEGLGTEINLQTVYHGVGKAAFAPYAAGTAYSVGDLITYTQNNELRYFRCVTATSAGQNPDTHPTKWAWAGARALTQGFGKIISDEITANNLAPVATGAVTAANGYDKTMLLWRSLPEAVKLGQAGQGIIYQSMTDYEYTMDQYESSVSKNFETIDGITYLAKTEKRCGLKPVSWLSGSRRMLATVLGNLVAGTDELSDMNSIKTIPAMYTIPAGITFVIGLQIQDLEVLKVTDQA
jgi:hypothetical protein